MRLELSNVIPYIWCSVNTAFAEADPENLDRGGQTDWGALLRVTLASQKGASRGYISLSPLSVGAPPDHRGGGGAWPPWPPLVYPPPFLLLGSLVIRRNQCLI